MVLKGEEDFPEEYRLGVRRQAAGAVNVRTHVVQDLGALEGTQEV